MAPLVGLVILLGICLLPVVWFIGTYNTLVRTRNTCDEAWSDIDTELKRRYELIPNLVETVKGYAAHEREVLEAVIEARNRARGIDGVTGHAGPRGKCFYRHPTPAFRSGGGLPATQGPTKISSSSRRSWPTPRTASRRRGAFITATCAI